MADISQDILDLNARITKARDKHIRAQERKAALQRSFDALIEDIKAKGYDPSQLKEHRNRLVTDLQTKKQDLELKLAEAERQLSSIPE